MVPLISAGKLFYLSRIEHKLRVPPDLHERPIEEAIRGELFVDKVIANLGLCISVYDIRSRTGGFIFPREGSATYTIGKMKVFLRVGQMAELDARRTEVLAKAARLIQRQIRTHLTRKEFIALRRATIHMQKLWRAQLAREFYEQMRREAALIHIQTHLRVHIARKSYTQLKASAIVIQTGLRGMATRNEYIFKRRTKSATIVQDTLTVETLMDNYYGLGNPYQVTHTCMMEANNIVSNYILKFVTSVMNEF
ncbi:hypothetical protein FNV43_RR00704 [Rhamnella rubrinervis]|uniref:RNA polymerase Rpb7-like N-terminal domain-containing protein n=1 Tax=Rhamnella rubrinervis TaxID=2594499 RepID=A0A8K0HNA6_9ROSA|nr:hypothetical protein FNV43_RR00704 [Rhamnella rubrinervis]